MISRETPQSHERHGHRDGQFLRQVEELLRCIGGDNSASDIEKRPFRLQDKMGRPLNLAGMTFKGRPGSTNGYLFRIFKLCRVHENIFGEIDENRSRPSAPGDIKRLLQYPA